MGSKLLMTGAQSYGLPHEVTSRHIWHSLSLHMSHHTRALLTQLCPSATCQRPQGACQPAWTPVDKSCPAAGRLHAAAPVAAAHQGQQAARGRMCMATHMKHFVKHMVTTTRAIAIMAHLAPEGLAGEARDGTRPGAQLPGVPAAVRLQCGVCGGPCHPAAQQKGPHHPLPAAPRGRLRTARLACAALRSVHRQLCAPCPGCMEGFRGAMIESCRCQLLASWAMDLGY